MNKKEFFEFLTKYKEDVLSEDFFIANNGLMDVIVNEWLTHENLAEPLKDYPNVTKDEYHLGGYIISEQDYDDWILKYNYGYQYTKYGEAAILQSFGSLENYYKRLSDKFFNFIEINKDDIKYFEKQKYKDGYLLTANINDIKKYMDKIDTQNYVYDVPHSIKDDKVYIEFYSKK